jgi:glycosyltransferase involved in cell wall biosynthesis
MLPRISIITPSFNQAKYIKETIKSVLAQDYSCLEYLVIDGGSTDGTLEILRQYEERLSWISEPDEGQAQAINKGFKLAQGEIVAWLNSDDVYLPGALHRVADFFSQHPDLDLVYGDYYVIDSSSKVLLRKKEIPFDYNILLYGLDYISQPATFFRRSVFKKVGYLDESLHYGLDWEYWLRLASRGCKLVLIPHYLAAIRWQPQAKTLIAPPQLYAEQQAIQDRYWAKHRFQSPLWHRLYATWLNKTLRFKRQALKVILRRTVDFPPGNWVLKKQQSQN